MRKYYFTVATLALMCLLELTNFSGAQNPTSGCQGQTVAACAQKLVEIANKLADENQDLTKRISALEKDMANYKTKNDATVNSLDQSLKDQKSTTSMSAPSIAYWEKGAMTVVSGNLDLKAQQIPGTPAINWLGLRVFFGKTFKSAPVVISSTGRTSNSTVGNIADVRLDHFDIYTRVLPSGVADPMGIPLYFAVFPPHE